MRILTLFFLILSGVLLAQNTATMNSLPSATVVNSTDLAWITQSGVSKKAQIGLLRGFTTYGTVGQQLRVNSEGTGLEFFTPSASGVWGNITGTLSNQTDLQAALDAKQNTLTLGNLTTSTTGLSITGGTGAVVGSGATVDVQNATTGQAGLLTASDWNTFNGKQAALVSTTNIKSVNGTTLLGAGNLAVGDALVANPVSQFSGWPANASGVLTNNGSGTLSWGNYVATSNTSSSLTDGGSITITGTRHHLTTTQATITFADTFTGDFSDIIVTFNQTSSTWTFPSGALCSFNGTASGTNTMAVTGTSGDKIILSRMLINSGYYYAAFNFGQ